MSGETSMEDLPLIDLFRSEVETHAEVLSAALLALEASPGDVSRLGEMMRAAHSIKGAARVVGVDPAVSVAHVMEDCFVAAQKAILALSPADIDVLLSGVDLLGKISVATRDPQADLANTFDGQVKALVAELEAMLVPGPRRGVGGTESQTSRVVSPSAELASGTKPVAPSAEPPPPRTSRSSTITIPAILDSTAAEEVRTRFLTAIEDGCDSVRFDMKATKDLDVQGLALLAAVARHAADRGRPLIGLSGLSTEMETVLSVTGLSRPYGVRTGVAPGDE